MKFISFLLFAVELCLIFMITILFDLNTKIQNEKIIEIPQGSAKNTIIALSKKYPDFNIFDPFFLSKMGKLKYGLLQITDQNITKIDFFYELVTAKPAMKSITLIPGETTLIFFRELAQKENLSEIVLNEEFNATAPFYEGFLIPETYKVALNADEKEIINSLVSVSKKFHENLSRELLGDFNQTKWHEILIKASVIQKEAANNAEMPLISSVIDNRLAKNMKLQMDGTLNYGEFSHTKITPERILNDKSGFNTYIIDGLPKNAVCVVSKNAITAAIKPEKTEFLYFMRNKKTGLHDFSKNYGEHLKNVSKQR
ncbi:endolytic transglycosylase MltG [Campylobacter hominis]|uniref:endolytic transglycosylase MltG n=1 Tax=Campylobacter hominis TaxID=76517 RepID=UPI00248CCBEB|nr:endolytic transglycosylase MltG [Campylobacter hominis]